MPDDKITDLTEDEDKVLPTELGDDKVNPTNEGEEMATEGNRISSININETLVMESVQAHQHTMNESKANIQSSNNVMRHTAAKKFDQVDAIEASAVEKVLKANG